MSDTVIRHAALALNPNCPIMALAALAHGRRSTAKSWATGHRRPSIETLKILCNLLQERRAVLNQLIPELEYLIMLREREPSRARGFMLRDPATGSDRRNRLGRPKKITLTISLHSMLRVSETPSCLGAMIDRLCGAEEFEE